MIILSRSWENTTTYSLVWKDHLKFFMLILSGSNSTKFEGLLLATDARKRQAEPVDSSVFSVLIICTVSVLVPLV
ncbi:5594_t:CDS:2 [Gigaspora rosea]|nr:5594_t:CDS:2 [Gigaspora rosea]